MTHSSRSRPTARRAWRAFGARDGRVIESAVRQGGAPLCPGCGAVLEASAESRISSRLPLGARAFDFDCRSCRRYWSLVQHTDRSLRLLRMRRFVAAVRAAEPVPARAVAETAVLA